MTSVLRLGVYRERIEKYGGRRSAEPRQPLEDEHEQPPLHQPPVGPRQQNGDNGVSHLLQKLPWSLYQQRPGYRIKGGITHY